MLIVAFMGYACFLGSCEEEGGSAAWVPPSSLRVCMDFLFLWGGERERAIFEKRLPEKRHKTSSENMALMLTSHGHKSQIYRWHSKHGFSFHFEEKWHHNASFIFSLFLSLSVSIIVSLTFSQKKNRLFLSLSISLSLSLSGRTTCLLMSEKKTCNTRALSFFSPFLLLISNVTSSLWSAVTVDAGKQTDWRARHSWEKLRQQTNRWMWREEKRSKTLQ